MTPRHRRRLAVLFVFTLAVAVVLTGPARPGAAVAAAVGDPVVGQTAEFHIGPGISMVGAGGWRCDGAMYWEIDPAIARVWIKGECEQGWAIPARDVEITLDVPGCPQLKYTVSRLGEGVDTLPFAGQFTRAGGSPTCSGAVTQFCWKMTADDEWLPGDNSQVVTGCAPIALSPPTLPDPANLPGQGASSCPRGLPLEPWVTQIHAVAVPGGWRWESEGTLRISGKTDPASSSIPKIGSQPMHLYAFAKVQGTGASISFTGTAPVRGVASGDLMLANFDGGIFPNYVNRSEVGFKVVGPTLTTAFGSGVPSFQYVGMGFFTQRTPWETVFSGGATPYGRTTLTQAEYETASTGFSMSFAGNHKPEWCDFNWGTQYGAARTGPIQYQLPANATPPVYVPPNTTPPVIEIDPGGGCSPTATVCVDGGNGPGEPTKPPSIPDDEGSECNFSISNPSTWGGQLICALVSVAKAIIGVLDGIARAIAGLVTALINGLLGLLQSLFIPEEFPSFSDVPVPLPSGWLPSFPELSDGSCGPLVMPALDLGGMVGSTAPKVLFDTCDPPWPTVRTLTYYGLLASVLVAVGHRAMRVVMNGLGMGVESGAGGGDD